MAFETSTIVITGASAGIGQELALSLAKQYGSSVQLALCARTLDKLEQLKTRIEQEFNTPTLVHPCDVTIPESCQEFINKTVETFRTIDVLVLNAGVSMWSHFSELQDPNTLKPLMDVNYYGAVNPLFYALPHLRNTRGQVLGISSLQGYIGIPKHCGYSAAKHALHGFFDSVASEEPDIQFKKIILGWVRNTNIRNARAVESAEGEKRRQKHTIEENTGAVVKKNSTFSVSAKDCAAQIIQAIESNKSQSFIPSTLKWVWLLNMPFPNWVRGKIKKAVEKE